MVLHKERPPISLPSLLQNIPWSLLRPLPPMWTGSIKRWNLCLGIIPFYGTLLCVPKVQLMPLRQNLLGRLVTLVKGTQVQRKATVLPRLLSTGRLNIRKRLFRVSALCCVLKLRRIVVCLVLLSTKRPPPAYEVYSTKFTFVVYKVNNPTPPPTQASNPPPVMKTRSPLHPR